MTLLKKIAFALALLLILFTPLVGLAGPGDVPNDQPKLEETLKEGPKDVLVIINRLIDWIRTIVLVLAVLFVLFAAYKYLTSGGSEENLTTAHKALLWAVVAIAVALLATGINSLVRSLVLDEDTPTLNVPEDGSLDIWNSVGGAA